jgi:hypothetical protein
MILSIRKLKCAVHREWAGMKTLKARLGKRMKFAFLLVGFLLTLFGWYVDNGEDINWVVGIFARDYLEAQRAYERMLDTGAEIKPADAGFSEIVSILSDKLSGPLDLIIGIKARREGIFAIKSGGYVGPTITLEVTLQDGRSATLESVTDLQLDIHKRLLENTLFQWGQLIFLIGFALSFITAMADFIQIGD